MKERKMDSNKRVDNFYETELRRQLLYRYGSTVVAKKAYEWIVDGAALSPEDDKRYFGSFGQEKSAKHKIRAPKQPGRIPFISRGTLCVASGDDVENYESYQASTADGFQLTGRYCVATGRISGSSTTEVLALYADGSPYGIKYYKTAHLYPADPAAVNLWSSLLDSFEKDAGL